MRSVVSKSTADVHDDRIAIDSAALRNGSIVPDGALEEHRAAIANEWLVIFRGAYDADRLIRLHMWEPRIDYLSGGVTYRTTGTWTVAFEQFRMGDILAWRYDMLHGIEAVDPEAPLTWLRDDGFWHFALEMDEVHKASAKA
jgi:hypothetical protein